MRKTRLVDCNPHWITYSGQDGSPDGVYFECPEGHEGCRSIIPFTPALDGTARPVRQSNGAHWQRTGDTFETLSLTPSIRNLGPCYFHGFITNGEITFCGDSK